MHTLIFESLYLDTKKSGWGGVDGCMFDADQQAELHLLVKLSVDFYYQAHIQIHVLP